MSAPAVAVSDAQIHERIVSAILDQRLAPGTKLGEDKLAGAFGVSRTRIRPVLARLASQNIVTLTPNRGATVAQPTEQEAGEVFEARRLIEPRLVALFIARASQADVAALARCIDEEEVARRAGDARRAIRLSGDFHLLIAQGAGQQTLEGVLRELVSRTSLILMAYSPPRAASEPDTAACGCREHRVLLDAVRLRDAAEAARRMDAHLCELQQQLRFAVPEAAADLAHVLGVAGQA